MDRASDSGSEGWGFESLPAYQSRIIRTLSQQEKGSDYFCFWVDIYESRKPRYQPLFRPPKCVSFRAVCMRKGAAKLAAPCVVTYLLYKSDS